EKRRTGFLVDELWLIDPQTMMVMWDPDTRTKSFKETRRDGREIPWSSDDILHVTGLSLDGIVGVSRISYCRQGLGTAISREEFEGSFYKRGAVMSGIVEHPNTLKTEGIKNLRESMKAIYGGSKNAFETGVLEEGATFKTLSMPLSDMQ